MERREPEAYLNRRSERTALHRIESPPDNPAVSRTVRYAVNDDVHIAYEIVGDGPIDLVYTPGIWSNLEAMWEWPAWAAYLERLASFSRLILFDMRGIGLSDRGWRLLSSSPRPTTSAR